MLLEARALSDLSRTDLALEILSEEEGADVDRLRADIFWSARRWREAGEAHEAMTGTRWQDGDELAKRERTDILRAAIAYSLGDEPIALDRLRAKYLDQMSQSEDAEVFAVASRPPKSRQAKPSADGRRHQVVTTCGHVCSISLRSYRKRHPETALPLRGARRGMRRVCVTVSGRAGGSWRYGRRGRDKTVQFIIILIINY